MAEPDDKTSGLELVYTSNDPAEIQMARDLLTDSGIEVFVFGEVASRMLGSTVAIETRLMVPVDRAAEAREALQGLGFE